MILWKNLISNSICLIFDILLLTIILINQLFYKKTRIETLLNIIYCIIIIFVITRTFIMFYNNPFYIRTDIIDEYCVSCFDSSKVSGIKCKICKKTTLCVECYNKWKSYSGNCPLCRNKLLI